MITYEDYTIEEVELEKINEEYEKIIEQTNVKEHLYNRDNFISNSISEEDKTRRALEMMGSKIISAIDVESNRKIDYKFWKDDREFSDYDESKSVVGIETKGGDGSDNENNMADLLHNKNNDNANVSWLDHIDLSNSKIVRALILSIGEKNNEVDGLPNILWYFFNFVIEKIKLSTREKEVLNCLAVNINPNDIAGKLNTGKQNISNVISRICNKVIDSGLDILDIVPNSILIKESIDEEKN